MRGQRPALSVQPAGLQAAVEQIRETADAERTARLRREARDPVLRRTRHRAGSQNRERRAVARIEATCLGLDIRVVDTNVERGSSDWVDESPFCARARPRA